MTRWDNSCWWPQAYRPRETWTHAYRTLEEAGIGRFDDASKDWQDWFALGFGVGLLLGLGLIDLLEAAL